MIAYIKKLFNKPKSTKLKTLREQLLNLSLGSYVAFNLDPDIISQHIAKGVARYDEKTLLTKTFKGLVKAVYVNDTTNIVYVEVVGLVVNGETATRKEYVVLEHDVKNIDLL